MHVDPLWTNAWVAVLQGKKRWMLFPPETPLEKIGIEKGKPQMNSATWYSKFYDKVTSDKWPIEWRPYEVLQNPDEIVFVPNGWPHLVVNLELTVAVTHNYASEFGPFARMYSQISHDEPEFFASWLKGIHAKRPDLLEILNGDVDSVDEDFNYDLGLK
jgi:histone arginine demethylase JMJD6